MPVYAFAPQRENKPTPGEQAVQLGNVLGNVYGQYQAQQKEKANRAIVDNPNSTPLQRAMAISELGSPQVAQQHLKQAGLQEIAKSLAAKYPGLPGGQQQVAAQNIPGATPPIQDARALQQQHQQALPMAQPEQIAPQQAQVAPQPSPEQDLAVADQFRKRAADYASAGLKPQADVDLAEANAIENRVNSQRKAQQQLEFQERKENEGYRQHILSGIPQTKKLKAQLGRLEKLSAKAETTPAAVKALNFFGIPIGSFDTPNAQELDKIANDLTATIQSDYGNRILATEFNTFLKRIPTLLNSEAGRKRILRNMNLYADAIGAEQKAYQDIYRMQKQSGIQHPIVRQEDVMELVEPQLDAIFDKLNSELVEDSGTKEAARLLPQAPQGTIRMTKDGRFYDIPADQVPLWKKMGLAPL